MTIEKRSLVRLAAAVLGVLLFLLMAAYALLLWESHRQRQRAEALLRDLQTLKIGETPAREAMQLIRKYGEDKHSSGGPDLACGRHSTRYWLERVRYPTLSLTARPLGDLSLGNRFVNNLGVRYWTASSSITLHGDRLVCYDYKVGFTSSDGTSVHAEFSVQPPMRPVAKWADFNEPYFGQTSSPSYEPVGMFYTGVAGDGLGVIITHRASQEERRRAFDINFDCLTRLRECRRACELMPSVWREEVRKNRAEGRKALKGESDPQCQAVLGAGK